MALNKLSGWIGERVKEAKNTVSQTIDKGMKFFEKYTSQTVEQTRKETSEVLHHPEDREKRQKRENLDLLLNTGIREKNIQVINKKTGTVREFSGYSANGKVIFLNKTTGQKEIMSRELLERDAYEVKSFPVTVISEIQEKGASKEKVMLVIKELDRDRFVKNDVRRLLREKFEGTYRAPKISGEIRDKSTRIVEQLMKSRTKDLARLVYKYLKDEALAPKEEVTPPLFGVEADQEISWMNKAEGPLFGENSGNQKVEWMENISVGNRMFKNNEMVTYREKPNAREYQGTVVGKDENGNLIIQRLATQKTISFAPAALSLVKNMPGNPVAQEDEKGRMIVGSPLDIEAEAEKRRGQKVTRLRTKNSGNENIGQAA